MLKINFNNDFYFLSDLGVFWNFKVIYIGFYDSFKVFLSDTGLRNEILG